MSKFLMRVRRAKIWGEKEVVCAVVSKTVRQSKHVVFTTSENSCYFILWKRCPWTITLQHNHWKSLKKVSLLNICQRTQELWTESLLGSVVPTVVYDASCSTDQQGEEEFWKIVSRSERQTKKSWYVSPSRRSPQFILIRMLKFCADHSRTNVIHFWLINISKRVTTVDTKPFFDHSHEKFSSTTPTIEIR